MTLWHDIQQAAREGRERRHDFRERLKDARAQARPRQESSPTLTLSPDGQVTLDRQPHALVLLGRSIMLLVVSLVSMGLSWLTAGLMAFYLLLQRLLGLHVQVR